MTGSLTGRPAAGATGCLPGWGYRDRFPLRDRQVAPLRRIRDAQVPVRFIIASANRLPWARRLADASQADRSLAADDEQDQQDDDNNHDDSTQTDVHIRLPSSACRLMTDQVWSGAGRDPAAVYRSE